MTARKKSLLILHFTILIFGFTGILGKYISLETETLVWSRMFIALLTLFLFLIFTKRPILLAKKDMVSLTAVGFLIAVHWLTFFGSIKASNVSIALACLSSGAFFASILEPLAHRKKVNWIEVLMGLAVILALIYIFQFETTYQTGILLGLASAFFGAIFTVINSFYVQRIPAETVTFYEMLGGFLIIFVSLTITGNLTIRPILELPLSEISALIVLGTICTAFAFVAFVYVMKQLSAFTVTLSVNLEPIYSILLAFYLFGEYKSLTPQFFVGAFVILATIIVNAYLKARSHRNASFNLNQKLAVEDV